MKLNVALIATTLLAAPLLIATPAHAQETAPGASESRVEAFFNRANDLVLNAMGFMGIPYKWGGATPEAGFDCSGFVQYVFRQATGVLLPRSSFDQIRQGVAIARDQLQPGDLVFFNTMRATASHVGIYIGENRFIHSPSRGKSVEIGDVTNAYWQTRYDGARRLPL
jgi:cell wall-associated NlpC family hydrolase